MNLKPCGANQTEVTIGNKVVLFSYRTPVAYIEGSHGYRTERNWSVTTKKHIGQFFNRHFINNVTEVFQEDIEKVAA